MTTADLIARLRELDPSGTTPVLVFGGAGTSTDAIHADLWTRGQLDAVYTVKRSVISTEPDHPVVFLQPSVDED